VLEERTCRSGVTWYVSSSDVLVVARRIREDYTNRGRLITPLKAASDPGFAPTIPSKVTREIAIMHQEAKLPTAPGPIKVPWFIDDIARARQPRGLVAATSSSELGVSVRLSIANYETVVANALRRTLRTHDDMVVPP